MLQQSFHRVSLINSYLIEQVGLANHLPSMRPLRKILATEAFDVRRETTDVGRGGEQEIEHLPLLIFPKASCATIDTEVL
jgi:hypothetical protein